MTHPRLSSALSALLPAEPMPPKRVPWVAWPVGKRNIKDQRGHLNRMLRFWAQWERATAFSPSLASARPEIRK